MEHAWSHTYDPKTIQTGATAVCECGLMRQWNVDRWLYAEETSDPPHAWGDAVDRVCTRKSDERIVAAAVRTKSRFNDHVLVWSVTPPGRHCDLMPVGDREAEERLEQGFVTSSGRFVGRKEAYTIAVAANQLLSRAQGGPSLFSEDVW